MYVFRSLISLIKLLSYHSHIMATCPILLKSLSKLKLLVTIDFKTKVIGNFNNFTYTNVY